MGKRNVGIKRKRSKVKNVKRAKAQRAKAQIAKTLTPARSMRAYQPKVSLVSAGKVKEFCDACEQAIEADKEAAKYMLLRQQKPAAIREKRERALAQLRLLLALPEDSLLLVRREAGKYGVVDLRSRQLYRGK